MELVNNDSEKKKEPFVDIVIKKQEQSNKLLIEEKFQQDLQRIVGFKNLFYSWIKMEHNLNKIHKQRGGVGKYEYHYKLCRRLYFKPGGGRLRDGVQRFRGPQAKADKLAKACDMTAEYMGIIGGVCFLIQKYSYTSYSHDHRLRPAHALSSQDPPKYD